ncbi:MAG: radical SAM protein [bacterium]|nr:radical SAM protein [bacterium]
MIKKNIEDKINSAFKEIFLSNNLTLIIFPTEECNFRCTYCYENFRKIYIKEYVINGILNIVDRYSSGNVYLSFFGGEPLLGFRYIQKIINKIKEKGIKIKGSITTNGYLLTERVFKYLINENIRSFQITIDGDEKTHNITRVLKNNKDIPTFNVIYNNILKTKEIEDFFEIIIRANVNENNKEGVKELINRLSIDFKNDKRYKFFLKPVKDWKKYNYNADYYKESLYLLNNEEKTIYQLYKYALEKGLYLYIKDLIRIAGEVCYAGKPKSFIIRADGRIQKCTIILDNDDLNTIGYIKQNSEIEIDNDKHKIWYSINALNSKKCKGCNFVDVCFGLTCPLKTITEKEPTCCSFKVNYKKYLKLFPELN